MLPSISSVRRIVALTLCAAGLAEAVTFAGCSSSFSARTSEVAPDAQGSGGSSGNAGSTPAADSSDTSSSGDSGGQSGEGGTGGNGGGGGEGGASADSSVPIDATAPSCPSGYADWFPSSFARARS
jgi:hypothetical protein